MLWLTNFQQKTRTLRETICTLYNIITVWQILLAQQLDWPLFAIFVKRKTVLTPTNLTTAQTKDYTLEVGISLIICMKIGIRGVLELVFVLTNQKNITYKVRLRLQAP